MKKIRVDLGKIQYDIVIGTDLLNQIDTFIKGFDFEPKCGIITDTNVNALYGTTLKKILESSGFECIIFQVPAGESTKSLETATGLIDQLMENKFNRHTPVIALGGGLINDLAGFVSAVYMRGLPLIQVPTTLMAQVDSSIGGKVGVNYNNNKNMLGTFYQPKLIISDLNVLKSLPKQELSSGFAEVVKYGMILDKSFFEYLETNHKLLTDQDEGFLEYIVSTSSEFKARVIERDVRDETGIRAVLNYGHTIGHALESVSDYKGYLHGEAVAVGMAYAAKISSRLELMEQADVQRQNQLLHSNGLNLNIGDIDPAGLIKAMDFDKKQREAGVVRFILTEGIGKAKLMDGISLELIHEVLGGTIEL
ncbi:MAG: 3-dehydroquinate synthase [Thermoplasmata archaeon]|nr:MAG: 3-dehydroquinate synthase [Thermoplasmata archaeon]